MCFALGIYIVTRDSVPVVKGAHSIVKSYELAGCVKAGRRAVASDRPGKQVMDFQIVPISENSIGLIL